MVHRHPRKLTRRFRALALAVVAVGLGAAGKPPAPGAEAPGAGAPGAGAPDAETTPREEIVIAGETFRLEVAADHVSRARGLMDRERIDAHGGMLFIYRDVRRRWFWMKNCLVDIDLIYLGSTGRIVQCHEMKQEPPRRDDETEWAYEWRLKSYPSRRPAQFVIELKAGSIDRLKLKPGQVIELDYTRLRKLAR